MKLVRLLLVSGGRSVDSSNSIVTVDISNYQCPAIDILHCNIIQFLKMKLLKVLTMSQNDPYCVLSVVLNYWIIVTGTFRYKKHFSSFRWNSF